MAPHEYRVRTPTTDLFLQLAADVPHAADHHLERRALGPPEEVELVGDQQGHVLRGGTRV